MRTRHKFIIAVVIALLVANASLVAVYYFFLSPASKQPERKLAGEAGSTPEPGSPPLPTTDLGDEYYSIHFSYADAVDLCIQETRSRNSNLIQLSVNERSTRFNDLEGVFMVKIDTYVGTPMLYDEKVHTCHVDPKTQGVAYYKEIIRRKAVRPVD